MALIRKRNQGAYRVEDLCYYPVSGIQAVVGSVTPYFVEVRVRFRMERITTHAGWLRWASVVSFRRANASSPSMG